MTRQNSFSCNLPAEPNGIWIGCGNQWGRRQRSIPKQEGKENDRKELGPGAGRTLDKLELVFYFSAMMETATPEVAPTIVPEQQEKPKSGLEPGYLVVCWNDPVNFMDYVTHVFQR